MAILYARPAGDLKLTVANFGERIWTSSFIIKSNTPYETQEAITNCGLLPIFGYSPFPQDLLAICSRVDVQQNKENGCFWTATCEWRTVLGKNPQNEQKKPDQRRPVWSYSFQPITKYFPADLDGNPFVDTAGTPFDPPPERPIWVDEITVERYESSMNRAGDRQYINAYNSDSWLDAEPGEAFIHNIAAVEVFEFNAYWFRRTFTILVSPRIQISGTVAGPNSGGSPFVGAWDYECVLNQGPQYLAKSGPNKGKPQPVSAGGYVDGRAKMLDANGAVLVDVKNPVYLKFRTKNKASFGDLNLVPPY
jgi:hypothetical protein